MIPNEYRSDFCKIYSLPIKIFSSPVFESRIELLDELYNTKKLMSSFEKDIKRYRNYEAFIAEYNEIKETIIQHIKNKKEFSNFVNIDLSKYSSGTLPQKKKDLYKASNQNEYFLGFDLSQANFNAVRFFSPDIIDNKSTYELFIRQFTDLEYFINSKYIRQVIFGMCFPLGQVTIERYLMSFIYSKILNLGLQSRLVHFSDDEIVLSIKENEELEKQVLDLEKELGIKIKIEKYKLIKVNGADIYIKVFNNGKILVKCATSITIPFVIRAIKDSNIEELDKHFVFEGYESMFIDIPNLFVPLLKY